jgi:hypothetical protein
MPRLPSKSKLLTLLCSLTLIALGMLAAYQATPSYEIPFGTATDAVLLQGFGAGEGGGDSGPTYRWSTGDASIILQDIAQQDFDVDIQFNGWRPPRQPPPSLTISSGGRVLLKAAPPPQIIDYTFRVPSGLVTDGTLALHLTVNTFSPLNDPRHLGIWTQNLRVSPAPSGNLFIVPPAGPFVGVLAAAALLGLSLILLGWGAGVVFVGPGLVGALAIWLVATDRLWLTTGQWYLLWLQALFAGLVFIFLVGWLGGLGLRLGGVKWSAIERRVLLTVMLAAFVVRFGGQLHPEIRVEDLQYHVHRLQLVESGQMLFTTFAVQAGSRYSFYLPTAYVFITPLKWLVGEEALAVMLFTIGISTLGALLIFYIARRVRAGSGAGLLAGTLYLIMPISIIIFSWGITTNIFAEFFTLLVLAFLVGAYSSLRPNRLVFWLFTAALFVGLLGHSAAVQLLAVAFAATLLLLGLRNVQGSLQGEFGMRNEARAAVIPHSEFHIPHSKQIGWLLGAFAIAALAAFVVYYRNWVGDIVGMVNDMRLHNVAQATGAELHVKISGDVDDATLGLVPTYATTRAQWILGGLIGFWHEAQAYYRVWPIGGAALGWLLIPMRNGEFRMRNRDESGNIRQSPIRNRLALALLGWTLSAVLFALVGLALNLYVRYMLFALPVVALCVGLLLSAIWKRGRAGTLVSALLVVFFAVEALALWQFRIDYLFK